MATVSDALIALGIDEWVLRGEPTSAEEFGSMFRKVTGVDANGSSIESDNSADWGVTWDEVNVKLQELTAAEPMKKLREVRNAKLAETDWVITMHKELGTNIPAAWKTYRQELRDITETYSDLDSVVWPTKPE